MIAWSVHDYCPNEKARHYYPWACRFLHRSISSGRGQGDAGGVTSEEESLPSDLEDFIASDESNHAAEPGPGEEDEFSASSDGPSLSSSSEEEAEAEAAEGNASCTIEGQQAGVPSSVRGGGDTLPSIGPGGAAAVAGMAPGAKAAGRSYLATNDFISLALSLCSTKRFNRESASDGSPVVPLLLPNVWC